MIRKDDCRRQENDKDERKARKERRYLVPHALKLYLEEMVFGYGRSPASLRWYLRGVMDTLGATPEERRRNRRTMDGNQFQLFERMREYMKIVEDVTRQEDRVFR